MATDNKSPAAPEKMRILLVDDHPMVRERLTEVIQREPDLAVCGEAEDRFRALELIAATRPHLAIVDLTLRRSQGMELIKDIRSRYPALAVLVVSMHDEMLHAERVIRAGARGYITKQEATRKIMLAIRTVLNGGVYLSEKMATQIAASAVGRPQTGPSLPVNSLSDRELYVFEMIGQGRSTRQIADELHLDMRTIETYRARIKEKLNLKDANDLLQHAIHWMQVEGSL
ncbi:MAG: response regulator transcription factor [Verrucomicrobiia bacterium]